MTESNECIFGSLLSAFHDGELSDERRQEVMQHVRTCGVCAAELADIRRFASVFRAAPPVAFPADAELRLNAAFDHAMAERPNDAIPSTMRITSSTAAAKEPRHLSYVRWVSGIAAAVFVLAIGRVGYLQYNAPTDGVDPNFPTDNSLHVTPDTRPLDAPVRHERPPANLPGQS